jgi:hypothetical protein
MHFSGQLGWVHYITLLVNINGLMVSVTMGRWWIQKSERRI